MKNSTQIMWLREDAEWIAFCYHTLRIFKTDDDTYQLIEAILNNSSTDKWDAETVKKATEKYLSDAVEVNEIPPERIRLTLNVANACNMCCGYCYANGGVYHSTEQLMDLETAKRAIDLFYGKFRNIGSIKFIGGEPLMNLEVVKFVCDYVAELYDNHQIETMPSFIIATNGTILNDEIIEYSNRYHWRVGLSFDGQAWLHDRVRTYPDGSGTSEIIKRNIRCWQERTNGRCPSSINACYSRIHEENRITPAQMAIYLRDELNVEKVNIVPVDASHHSEFHLEHPEEFGSIVEELDTLGEEQYQRYAITKLKKLEKLLRSRHVLPKEICKAGLTTFGVSAKGIISPCHLLTDENGFYMGSIYDEDPFHGEAFQKIENILKTHNRYENAKCASCFANKICNGCIGGNLFRTGNPWTCDPEVCALFKKAVIQLIRRIARDME